MMTRDYIFAAALAFATTTALGRTKPETASDGYYLIGNAEEQK